jgi:hypothetical protein
VGGISTPFNAAGGASSEVTFTCTNAGTGSVTVATTDQAAPTLYCSDQTPAGNATCALATSKAGTACGTGTGTCLQVNCPASTTTQTITFVCGNPAACTGVGNGVEVTGDTATGACAVGSYNTGTLKDGQGNFCCTADTTPCNVNGVKTGSGTAANPDTSATGTCPANQVVVGQDLGGFFCCGTFTLLPCTTAGQTNCVQCQGNTSNVCTPTEAAIVAADIAADNVTAAGPDNGANSCYACLVASSCIDDSSGDINKECEDTTGSAAYTSSTTVAECEAVLQCILNSAGSPPVATNECAENGVSGCYCGTDPASSCGSGSASAPVTAGVNGACATQIATGLGFPLGDGADILKNFSVKTLAAGRANAILGCATSNGCSSCL